MGEVLALCAIVGPAVTKVVDGVRNFLGTAERQVPKVVWNVLALAFGLLVAMVGNVHPESLAATVGSETTAEVVIGLAFGGFGSGFHELFDYLSSTAKARHPA